MAPPCSTSLLLATGILFTFYFTLAMAAWLSSKSVPRNGGRLLSGSVFKAPVCFRGLGRTSSASGAVSAFQNQPRTIDDLPRVSLLEMLYRLVFQGFYNRMHELQVCQVAVCWSSLDRNVQWKKRTEILVLVPLHPKFVKCIPDKHLVARLKL